MSGGSSSSNGALPVLAQPEVFHKDGRRLFIIDGEPRIADIDIGDGLAFNRPRDVRKIIARQVENLSFFGDVVRVDPTSSVVESLGAQLRHGGAIARAADPVLIQLLQDEGLIDLSKRGKKPLVWFLNRDQMRWIVTKSETAQADDFLRELFRVYKAWEDGTLQPAAPAVPPPPVAPAALPPPAPPQRVTGISHDGVVYELEDGVLHVIDESLYRTAGCDPRRMRALFSDLSGVGPVPASESVDGALLLSLRHVELVVAVMRRDFDLPGIAVNSIVATLRDHGAGHLQVVAGTIVDPVGLDGVSRQYAAGRAGGPKVLARPPVPFLRGEDRRLRIRFSVLATAFGMFERSLAEEVRFHRAGLPGEVFERLEVQHGVDLAALYLDEVQAKVLGDLLGLDASGVVDRLFVDQVELEADNHRKRMEELAELEAREDGVLSNPTITQTLADLKEKVLALSSLQDDLPRLSCAIAEIGGRAVPEGGYWRRLGRALWGR